MRMFQKFQKIPDCSAECSAERSLGVSSVESHLMSAINSVLRSTADRHSARCVCEETDCAVGCVCGSVMFSAGSVALRDAYRLIFLARESHPLNTSTVLTAVSSAMSDTPGNDRDVHRM